MPLEDIRNALLEDKNPAGMDKNKTKLMIDSAIDQAKSDPTFL